MGEGSLEVGDKLALSGQLQNIIIRDFESLKLANLQTILHNVSKMSQGRGNF